METLWVYLAQAGIFRAHLPFPAPIPTLSMFLRCSFGHHSSSLLLSTPILCPVGMGCVGMDGDRDRFFPLLVFFLVLIPTVYSGVLPPSAGRAQHLQLSSEPSNFLNWKGPTRISKSSSWPCAEHPKNPIRCQQHCPNAS